MDAPERLDAISKRLKKDYHAQRVILYGSYARGEASADSDIDLLIIAATKDRFFKRMAAVRRVIRDLRQGLVISPLVLTPEEVETHKQNGNAFVLEIMQEGVEL